MTRGELRGLVLSWLDDLNAGYFTEDQVNVWLNNAQYEVQKQLLDCGELWYMTCSTANTVANVGEYSLPADFAKANRLELLIAGTMTGPVGQQTWSAILPSSLNEGAVMNYGTSQPQLVTIGRDCLILRPIPDIAYPMRLWYSYLVDPMNNDLQVPDVPPQYHEYIAVIAAWDGYMKDQRNPTIMDEKRKYYKDMMQKDQIQRNRSKPRHVIRTMDDGVALGIGF